MSDERWVVVARDSMPPVMLAPRDPEAPESTVWTYERAFAMQYVNEKVAGLAATILLPMQPVVIRRVR